MYYKNLIAEVKEEATKLRLNITEKNHEIGNLNSLYTERTMEVDRLRTITDRGGNGNETQRSVSANKDKNDTIITLYQDNQNLL